MSGNHNKSEIYFKCFTVRVLVSRVVAQSKQFETHYHTN